MDLPNTFEFYTRHIIKLMQAISMEVFPLVL